MMHRRFLLSLSLCAAVLTLSASVCAAQEKHAHHWSYSGKEGPEHWGDLEPEYATCKTGQHQSPIDIHDAKKSDLPAIQFDYHAAPLRIINNGHSVQVNYSPGSFITVGGKRYELRQFHFHHPSEETIDGKHFEMVIHLVHADDSGNFAAVAVLLKMGAENPAIEALWSHLPKQAGPEQKFEDVRIDASGLLPSAHGYYTYAGSLTTPPCGENVTWYILRTPATISKEQAAAFARLYEHNVRPIQPLNGRVVLESK
jgi:carbonic anhydrase